MRRCRIELLICGFVLLGLFTSAGLSPDAQAAEPLSSYRLPDDVPPVIAVRGWTKDTFKAENYKAHIDMMARHSGVNVLATTLRAPGRLVTNKDVHDTIKDAALYAGRFGIKIAMDLDVRLARETFAEAYPDELCKRIVSGRVEQVQQGGRIMNEGIGSVTVSEEIRNAQWQD